MANVKKTPKKPDDPEQSKRFEDKARELESDESGKTFENALHGILTPSSKSSGKKKKD